MKKRKFWNWVRDSDTGERTLVLNGQIAEESWFGDEVTPAIFRDELMKGEGNITVWINSPGGDVFAAAQIYNMLMDYKGDVTVRIDGLAASAASMIAMAGTTVEMSPVGMLMVHNPSTAVIGNTKEMQAAIKMLDEVKESIINAYEIKTGQSRTKLSHLMDSETWMNAWKAKELGFCDEVMFAGENDQPDTKNVSGFSYARKTAAACLMNRLVASIPKPEPEKAPVDETRILAADAEDRLLKTKYL